MELSLRQSAKWVPHSTYAEEPGMEKGDGEEKVHVDVGYAEVGHACLHAQASSNT